MRSKFLPMVMICLLAAYWGYHNHLKFLNCQQHNQELIQELKLMAEDRSPSSPSSTLSEGDFFPLSLRLPALNAESISLASGGTFLLIFISTSCPACVEVALEIYSDVSPFTESGLIIVSISRDSPATLSNLIKEKNWPLPLAYDSDGQLHRLFQISSVPSVVFIDKGKIKLKAEALSIDRRWSELKALLTESQESQGSEPGRPSPPSGS
ncbi:MAG: redoxin domain-containing protein [Candidatus Saccharicenans sp.]